MSARDCDLQLDRTGAGEHRARAAGHGELGAHPTRPDVRHAVGRIGGHAVGQGGDGRRHHRGERPCAGIIRAGNQQAASGDLAGEGGERLLDRRERAVVIQVVGLH